MSYILVATDFSETSANSTTYAAALASELKMQLSLVHSFIFPAMLNDVTIPASLIDDTRDDAMEKMGKEKGRLLALYPNLQITTSVHYGMLADILNSGAAEKGNPFLLVMGNSNTQEDTSWFFSTLKGISNDTEFAVLAVPYTSTYKTPERICYADDVEQVQSEQALRMLTELTSRFNAQLDVVNVQPDGSMNDDSYDVGDGPRKVLADANPKYHYLHNEDTNDAIKNFCTAEKSDWLAIMPGTYGWIEGIFHKSHTKTLAQTMNIPLLILH